MALRCIDCVENHFLQMFCNLRPLYFRIQMRFHCHDFYRSVNVPIIKRTLCQDKLSENLYVKFCPVFASKTSIHVLGNQRYDSIFVDGHLGILLGKMCERGTQIMRYHHVSWWMDFAIVLLMQQPSCTRLDFSSSDCDNNQKAYKT